MDPYLAEILQKTTRERISQTSGYDAIVIGAGAAGGLAAALLCELGMQVLVLDAGWRTSWAQTPARRAVSSLVGALANPKAAQILPYRAVRAGQTALKRAGAWRQPVQTQCYAWERAPDSFVDDLDDPYTTPEEKPFCWFRARQVGGRMIIPGHGRQYFRLGPKDFAPDDGLSPAWPLDPGALDPWYDLAEGRLALSGAGSDNPWIPPSRTAHRLTPNPSEYDLMSAIRTKWPGCDPILGQFASPYPGLAAAARTGRLDCRQGAIARQIDRDAEGSVEGVTWFDRAAKATLSARAPVVFCCASSLESVRLLLLSGLGEAGPGAEQLGRNIMDHVLVKAEGLGRPLAGEPVALEDGRCVYIPRFDLRKENTQANTRGYGVQAYQVSGRPGESYFTAVAFAEMLPRPENHVRLNRSKRDAWGIPALHIECAHSAAEIDLAVDQKQALEGLADLVGAKLSFLHDRPPPPGYAVHECGGARMGDTPENSVLNPFNECWNAKGLYVTDSASFPSQGAQNPTLTIMALTARACNNAARASGGPGLSVDTAE